MRLIDADALPRCAQHGCNGGFAFVDARDIDAAPTITCETCRSFISVADKTLRRRFSYPGQPLVVVGICEYHRQVRFTADGCSHWELIEGTRP